jgi:ribosomal protein S7
VKLVSIYSNLITKKGNKNTAQVLLSKASDFCYQKYNIDFLNILVAATANALPCFETKRKRKGGTTILVPFPLKKNRQIFLAVKTILVNAKRRTDKNDFSVSLVNELIETITCQSTTYKARQNLDKKAELNRAYSFLRWN